MIYLKTFSNFISDQLGNIHNTATQGRGFLRIYTPQVWAIAIAVPVVIEIIKFAVSIRNKNEKLDLKSLKERAIRVVQSNACSAITSCCVAALFILFPEGPLIVYMGYSLILASHLFTARQKYKSENKLELIKHIFAAAVTAVTMGMMGFGLYPARWHHMSYGLLCMLSPFRAVSFFGGAMVIDSMLYWIRPLKDSYDFSDVFRDNMSSFIIQLVVLSVFQTYLELRRDRANVEKINSDPRSQVSVPGYPVQ